MKVIFERTCFLPSEPTKTSVPGDQRVMSGKRMKAGIVHELPDSMRDSLPRGAKILDDPEKKVAPSPKKDK